ncbi:MAG: HEAT repeat domain-containing protein [Planctomycetota bacterium]
MSRPRFLRFVALPLLAAVAHASAPLDVTDDFQSAIDLWSQGRKQESLDAMRTILAGDPDPEEVYRAYLAADPLAVTAFMAEGDEYTLVAKRFLDRARRGQETLETDADAIKEAVRGYMAAEDAVERLTAINVIRNAHGEYAAPAFINHLANESDSDKVRKGTLGLQGLGSKAVLPLVAALDAENAFLRRNVALTLGFIGDPRAGAHLLGVANSDESATVRAAAAEAAQRCGASGDAVAALNELGNAFHSRSTSVTFEGSTSDVVWSWGGDSLASTSIPRGIHNNELAKDAYYRALGIDASSTDALAGIARESVDIQAKLAALESAGQDVSAASARAQEGMLAVLSSGTDALDRALVMSATAGDTATMSRLAQQLGELASAPTAGLTAALASGGAAAEGEAAVALAHIATRTQAGAGEDVVRALGRAAERRVVKVAVLIDGDAQRAAGIVGALDTEGVLGQHAGSGTQGIVMLGQLAGVDAILLSDDLGDLTTDAVLTMIRQNPAYETTPVYLITSNSELGDAYGDRVSGYFAGADGIGALDEVFEAKLDDSRARADALAGRAADALRALSMGGRTDVSGAIPSLLAAIDGRRDGVAIPALGALSQIGDGAAAGSILAVLGNGDASDAVRMAAADALGSLGSRLDLGAEALEAARGILGDSGASLDLRSAAARAIGRMNLAADGRAGIVRDARVRVGGE